MKRQLLIAHFLSTPWAMMPEHLENFTSMLMRWQSGAEASEEVMADIEAAQQSRMAKRETNTNAGGGAIAVLPLYGAITQRGNMAGDISGAGGTSIQMFTQALRAALGDDTVGSILIDIDSPGGSVYGTSELANEIFQARSVKPIVAIANSLAASAAYWIGCSASEFYMSPGAEVGSIGVFMAHQDKSAAMEEAGIKTTYISAGKYKVEGNASQPLDAEAQQYLQSRVDSYYAAFTKGVARGRGVNIAQARDGMGQGRVLGADAAVAEQMVDGVATFDQVVNKMRKSSKSPATSASRLAIAQREIEIMG